MRDEPVEHGTGLAGFRRYTWWTVPGTTAFVLVVAFADWVVDPMVPAWARGTCVVALSVTALAIVVSLSRRLALLPGVSSRARPTAWLITGSAGAAVLGLIPLGFGEYGLWAVAPAMMVVIVAAFTSTRRRRVLIAGATLGAAVPGTIVNLARGDDEVLYARRSRPGCCCSPPG